MEKIKGYKVFNSDFTCRGFQYAENKLFTHKGEIAMCDSGLHFCESAADCFSYYSFDPDNIVCEVESKGKFIRNDNDSKVVTDKLFIGKKLSWNEVLKIVNTGKGNTGLRNSGYRNSGYSNSGNRNSGDRNSGYSNSGDSNSGDSNSGNRNSGYSNSGYSNSGNWNSGDRNSGDSNSGYRNSGAFCTDNNPKVFLFDKPTKMKVREWEESEAVSIMRELLETNEWIWSEDMSDEEKEAHPEHETTGGYLKSKTMHEAWADMWNNLTDERKKVFLDLPNFDAKKFKEITGIEVQDGKDQHEIIRAFQKIRVRL